MLKLTKIVAVLLLCIASNTVVAQTKEETISWITEKLKKHLVSSFEDNRCLQLDYLRLESVTPCEIQVSFTLLGGGGACKTKQYKCILPLDGIDVVSGDFAYNSEKLNLIESSSGKTSYTKWSTGYFSVRNGEDGLRERLQKALKHLATFCPQVKEAF
jgi:hypothetical protein